MKSYFVICCFIAATFAIASCEGSAQSRYKAMSFYAKNNVPKSVMVNLISEDWLDFIQNKQNIYVKRSFGQFDSQCFTQLDLIQLESRVPSLEQQFAEDENLMELHKQLKTLSAEEWQNLRERGLKNYKPTWTQLGKITPKGQTDAGQLAEKMIAELIIKLADASLKK